MLPSRHRLTSPTDFRQVVRRGRRQGRARMVVHLLGPEPVQALDQDPGPVAVGFTVSRAVGGSVVRNRVKRRLRHLCAARLDRLAPGSRVVVRALPAAATSTSAELAHDLDRALGSLLERAGTSG